jgi:hypothetical protein
VFRGVFLTMMLWSTLSAADISFEQLNAIAATPETLTGQFRQQKYLSELGATLDSSGVFSYRRNESIRWETLTPIQNVLTLTPNSIIGSQGEHEVLRLDAKSNPVIGVLSDVFFSVLTAKWGNLSAYFSLSGVSENGWAVELMPIDTTVMQLMEKVILKGDGLIRELTVYEKNGDTTTIYFENLIQ